MAIDPNDPRRKTYLEMIKLARDNRWIDLPAIFSNYLVIAICWEESTFMNIPQVGGPAMGFGQIEPDPLQQMSKKFNMGANVQQMHANMKVDGTSIEYVGRALHMLHDNLIRNAKAKGQTLVNPFMATLNGYAGNFGEYKAAWRAEAIQCWLKFTDIQRNAVHVVVNAEYVPNQESVRTGLFDGMPPNRRAQGQLWNQLMTNVLKGY
jgi:hypothetical protein